MQVSKKSVYTTNDGKIFLDRVEAAKHEFEDSLRDVMTQLGWGAGGEWSREMILSSLMEHHDRFQEIFVQFEKNLNQYPEAADGKG